MEFGCGVAKKQAGIGAVVVPRRSSLCRRLLSPRQRSQANAGGHARFFPSLPSFLSLASFVLVSLHGAAHLLTAVVLYYGHSHAHAHEKKCLFDLKMGPAGPLFACPRSTSLPAFSRARTRRTSLSILMSFARAPAITCLLGPCLVPHSCSRLPCPITGQKGKLFNSFWAAPPHFPLDSAMRRGKSRRM